MISFRGYLRPQQLATGYRITEIGTLNAWRPNIGVNFHVLDQKQHIESRITVMSSIES